MVSKQSGFISSLGLSAHASFGTIGGWVRGDKLDYDLWGTTVDDERWSYDGLLPFMKKTEAFWSDHINSDQHGHKGLAHIQSVTSTNREYPLRQKVRSSWAELGVLPLPGLDGNAGNPLGVGELQENKNQGRREISASIYPLSDITVLTETLVEKVIIEKNSPGGRDRLTAVGIKLADGTEIHGREIVLSAGAVRSPQILMLSGVGPSHELSKFNIDVLLDQPEVGKNFVDHGLLFNAWRVKNPSDGWTLESGNPLFTEPQYSWGGPMDFVVSTDVPKEGLAAAIAEDEGAQPTTAHPLLATKRTFLEQVILYTGGPGSNGSLITWALMTMLPTSRGEITLASADIKDPPVIDPNFLGTAVDRYVIREGVKMQIKFAGSNATVVGREIFDGEATPTGSEQLTVSSTDEQIDSRVRAGLG